MLNVRRADLAPFYLSDVPPYPSGIWRYTYCNFFVDDV